jgi:putative ABC transport system permease protein
MVKLSENTERYAFLLLKDNTDPVKLEKLFAKEKDKIPVLNDGTPGKYYLKSFKQTYFDTSEYSLLGNKRERSDWYHIKETNFAKLIVSCCVISLFLSMIGLFAISFHSSRKRTKEIGIRKINGATVFGVISLLNRDFFRWIIIAFVPASFVTWYIMHKWLQGFAYKTELNLWIFALAGLLTIAITFLTVSWLSWKAANRSPVDSLRYE